MAKPAAFARFGHEAMSTIFEILISGHPEEYAQQVASVVFDEIDHMERLLSRFDVGSDISQIARLKPGEYLRVTLEAYECIELAAQAWRETNGAFDITFRSRNADPDAPRQASAMEQLVISARPEGQEDVPHELAIGRLPSDAEEDAVPLSIDLGAIGKGFALDRVTEILSDWDVSSALLNAGTSTVLALDPPPDSPGWLVGVGGMWGASVGLETTVLRSMALSGSGTELKGEHVIDPRTGSPASHHRAAWVKCTSAALSDAFSTAFMVMSTEEVEAFCRSHAEVATLVVARGTERPVKFGNWD